MLKFRHTDDLNIETYEERINADNYVLMDKSRLELSAKYLEVRRDTHRRLAFRAMQADSGKRYTGLEKGAIIQYLTMFKGVDSGSFKSKGVQSDSLNSKRVLEPLLERKYAEEFLSNYIEYSSLKTICDRVPKLVQGMIDMGDVSNAGTPLHRVSFNVSQQENMRYNYNNQDLISIPKQFSDCFTVEDGYLLAWGDMGQADFRIAYNLFIRDEFNAPIMDACSDKYEGMARVLAAFFNEEFDYDKFKEERDIYKLNTLETIYGTKAGKNARTDAYIKRLNKYLLTCPRYQKYIRIIEDRYALGLPLNIEGYFGVPQPVGIADINRTRNKSLNTPVQTGTSQIIILTVNWILDKFYSLGYTKDDISVYIVRHDEPIFKMRKEVMKDAWVFKDAETIFVDGWTPLQLDFDYGYNYKIKDPVLTELAHESYSSNEHKLGVYEPDPVNRDFMPIDPVFVCNVGTEVVGDSTVALVYSPTLGAARSYIFETTNLSEVIPSVHYKILASVEGIMEEGYRDILIYNALENKELHENSNFFKYTTSTNRNTPTAGMLAHFIASKYATMKKVESFSTDLSLLKLNDKLIKSVVDLNVLQK